MFAFDYPENIRKPALESLFGFFDVFKGIEREH